MPTWNPFSGGHSTNIQQTGPGQYSVGMGIGAGYDNRAQDYRNALGGQPQAQGGGSYGYYGGAAGSSSPGGGGSGGGMDYWQFNYDPVTGEAVTSESAGIAPTTIDPATGQPITQQVDQNQLMSTHLNQLTAADSPYINQARQQAQNFAARRGLGNSTIAGGAGVAAGIQAAAPIAQFDASRYGDVANRNQTAEQQMAMANLSNEQQALLANQQWENQFGMADLGALNQMGLANLGYENQAGAQNAQIAAQMRQAEMQAQQAAANRAAASGNAAAARAAQERMFQLQQQGALDQMLFGHQLGGLDDYRRHGLGTETAQRQMDWTTGENALNRELDWAGMNYQNRALDANIFGNQFAPYMGAMQGIFMNPNLDAAGMNAVAGNFAGMFPNFSQQAWNSIPPGLFSGQAQGAAAGLPPMPNRRRGG